MTAVPPTVFANIQALPGWTAVTGSSIGPVVPTTFELTQPSDGFVTALEINATGKPGGYADGMARSAAVAIPPGATNAKTRFIFAVSAGHAANSQADEFGLMLTTPTGAKLYHVIQFNNSTSATEAVLDTTAKDYSWASTGNTLAKFAPGLHVVDITGTFNATESSVTAVEVDGVLFAIAESLYGVPAQALKWAPNIWFAEVQPDIDPLGGNEQVKVYYVGVQFS
jgi:hypothetical protein